MTTSTDLATATAALSRLTSDITTDQAALTAALADAKTLRDQVAAAGTLHQQDLDLEAALQGQIAQLKAQIQGKGSGLRLVFSDDFPLSKPVDKTRWNIRNADSASNNQAWYLERNAVVKADGLHLIAKHETGNPGQPATKPYTSAYLDTVGKFSQSVGRWEWVLRLPSASALWPAIWLRCDSTAGEIDVLEAIGGMADDAVQTVHQDTSGTADKSGFEYKPVGLDLTQHHTVGLERDQDGTLRWYVDGVQTRQRKPADLDNQGRPMSWLNGPTFASPLNMRMNLQVAGSMPTYYGKTIDLSQLPADMVIRSVHVYTNA